MPSLSFLSPALLWALPLALAPVLIHLVLLRRARRLPFGDLALLRSAYRRALPATRLRQWLLLAARCLLIALLVAAFARPVFHRGAAAAGEEGLEVVLLLDSSWSMGALERGKPRFEAARAAGAAILRAMGPADRAALASLSQGVDGALAWARPEEAAAALARMRPGSGTTDAAAALSAAYGFLAASPSRRRRAVVLLSDGAASSLRGLPAAGAAGLPGWDPSVALFSLSWAEEDSNAQIARARARTGEDGREALEVDWELFGPPRGAWSLDLWLGQGKAAGRALAMEGAAGRAEFALPASATGELWGRAELRRDRLAADDSFHFALKAQPRPRVLLLHGERSLSAGQGAYFLRKLLGEGGRLPYRLDALEAGRWERARLEDYAAVMLEGVRRAPPGLSAALERYALKGGGLWLFAGPEFEADAPFERLLPARLGRPGQPPAQGLIADEAPAGEGPRTFRWAEFELGQARFSSRRDLDAGPAAKVWFRDMGGTPVLAAGEAGRGRVLLWGASLDIRHGNVAVKPLFSAAADAGLRWLTGYAGAREWRTLALGEPIVRDWGPREAAPASVSVRTPQGRRARVAVRGRRAEFAETDAPGIYLLEAPSAPPEAYAVNLRRDGPEGDLRPPARPPWGRLRAEAAREDFLRGVLGEEARGAFLALALLLLALESWLSRPRRREAA